MARSKNVKSQELLEKAQAFFLKSVAEAHLANTKKLASLKRFKVNPLLDRYLAQFLTGNTAPRSIARAMLLPRILGTSITTTFGTQMQRFCGTVLQKGFGSTVAGIDIEFMDAVDGRHKYCQIKSGPETINVDDIETIVGKFKKIKGLARTNNVRDLRMSDLCVGVLYGTRAELNSRYLSLRDAHNVEVHVGKDFWHRLTGDPDFYTKLSQAFAEAAKAIDSGSVIEEVESKLAHEIAIRERTGGEI